MDCEPLVNVRSDPLHESMLEGLMVVNSRNILFTHCGKSMKYWPLEDIRQNLKNIERKDLHLFKEHGKEVPLRQLLCKSMLRDGLDFDDVNPLTPISKIEWYEHRNLLLVALRDSSIAFIKVFLPGGKFKYHRHRPLTFKMIKLMRTTDCMGIANIKVSNKLLLVGELNEQFKAIDMRNGQTVCTSAELNMEDWVQGICAAMDNTYLACSSIFGTLAIFKKRATSSSKHPTWEKAYYSQYYLDHKNGQGGIHCMTSTNQPDDTIIFIGGRKEAKFAKVSLHMFDVRSMTMIHTIQDDLSLGLFSSIVAFHKDDRYVIVTKNHDHKPGNSTLLVVYLRLTAACAEGELAVVDGQRLQRIDTVGTGYREGSLCGGLRNGGSTIEILNCSRSKTLHYLEISN